MTHPDRGSFGQQVERGTEVVRDLANTVKQIGLLVLSVPLMHVVYMDPKGNGRVAVRRSLVPKGSEIMLELNDGKLYYMSHRKISNQNWIAAVHIHAGPTKGYDGNIPRKYVVIPKSAGLTREQAKERGIDLGLFTE